MKTAIPSIGVYRITNLVNHNVYVGSTTKGFDVRWKGHKKFLRLGQHRNRFLQRAWNKYGETAFLFEIVESVQEATHALLSEQRWLDHYFDNGKTCYNLVPLAGSQRGLKWSEEDCALQVERTKKAWADPLKRRHMLEAIREAQNKPNHGQKISEGHKRISIIAREVRRLRSSQAGKTAWARHRSKLTTMNAKTYPKLVDSLGNEWGPIYNLTAFARQHRLTHQLLNRVARGLAKQHKGWRLL